MNPKVKILLDTHPVDLSFLFAKLTIEDNFDIRRNFTIRRITSLTK